MTFIAAPSFIDVMANPAAADITYATTHFDDPTDTSGGNLSDSGAQACTVTNTDGTLTLTGTESFTGTPAAAVTHIGVWHGNPSSGGTYRGCFVNDGVQAYNASGQWTLTTFSVTLVG